MKSKTEIALIICVIFLMSCSTMKHNINRNNKITEKIISSLLEKNGNVFYLNSTYTSFSTVWTYSKNNIEIYKLKNGKVSHQQEYTTTSIDSISLISKSELLDLDKCIELDGDGFGYKIKRGNAVEQQDLPISIKCFSERRYQSKLLNKIVDDINHQKMWEVHLQ